ncbi:MAG TPA: pyridoxal-phosphate dependent enzyme [Thermoanaerobaculaceae bacterium]|nr:pyridoxal-phosphate dependent enzyme [Thermoanaerobaculaceae bacterium]HRS14725.1 pyridoxal-phosphate dependent enzyme [Thermoanaerobaculaceae bacterium]
MSTHELRRQHAIERCRERGILIPTLAQQRDPRLVPAEIRQALAGLDMQAVDPLNLFRITWHNDPATGGYGPVNALELPSSVTGVPTRIVGLVGAHFPTGAHKVGAAFGCLVPRLVTGEFDPTAQRAVWPSTGNYCRGGAFDSALLACKAVAILPEEMSQERFRWLESIGAEIIATPGCESNVKEIFDACWRLRAEPDVVIFNQFEEWGNYLWHYGVTGPAAEEAFGTAARAGDRLAAWVSATGSAGTLAAGDYLKQRFPGCRIGVSEALQCPTLLRNGFGGHRIEGIGDKHVPWIHNTRNSDLVAAIDDEAAMRVFRLFCEPAGQAWLAASGADPTVVAQLPLLGISSVCNLLASIKLARHFELDEHDIVMTCFTDSSALYLSRLEEMTATRGTYRELDAARDCERYLWGATTDHLRELTHPDRKSLHNLKYFTWVEQQGRTVEELGALWSPSFWTDLQAQLPEWDRQIEAFNRETGVRGARPAVRDEARA